MRQIAKKELTWFSLIIFVFFLSILANGFSTANFVFAEIQSQSKLSIEKAEIRFTKTLWRGSRGDDVKRLQEFLKKSPDIYPEGFVTGYFGPLTEAAVKRLQGKYGIETVGIVGSKTRQKLNELFVAQQKITKPDEKSAIDALNKKEVLPTPTPDIAKPVPPLVTPSEKLPPSPQPTPKISVCGNQICEVDETSESCQSDCAISLNDCMPVLKNGDSSKKLDLVFLADSFPASKLAHFVTDIVPEYSGIREGSRGILAHEPFKSAKGKFNIWAIPIAETFDCAKIGCHRPWLGGETYTKLMAALSRCPFDFDEVVVVKYGPSIGRIFGYLGEKFTYIYYSDWLQTKNNNTGVLVHEFAHSFAKLSDDYGGGMKSFNVTDNPKDAVSISCDTAGCPQWCSGTPRYSYKDYAPECFGLNETDCKNKDSCVWIPDFITQEFQNKINPYYSGTSCVARRSDKDNGINCLAETGCYQGCGGGHVNWWRSANRSIMTSDYSEEFSGYHKKIINEALMKYE